MSSARPVSIANRHPRLRFDRRAVARLIQRLDAAFRILPADLPHLNRPSAATPGELRPETGVPSAVRDPQPAIPPGELSLVFLTDSALAQLHADFLDDPSSTDVITFEGDAAHGVAGEICVSADTAAAYARVHRHDFNRELTLYLIHGWLHLAGYDDLRPERKRVMRRAEARAQKLMAGAPACNPGFRLLRRAPARGRLA